MPEQVALLEGHKRKEFLEIVFLQLRARVCVCVCVGVCVCVCVCVFICPSR